MAKVILICGRICCGKSTYAQKLRRERKAVVLSVDEVMLTMFDEYLGDRHEICAERTRRYLHHKSLEIIDTGIDVILDWGFWTRKGREQAKAFYQKRGVETEFHYLHIGEEEWKRRCIKRNAQIDAGEAVAYHVDEGLAAKAARLFEEPARTEMDVWLEA